MKNIIFILTLAVLLLLPVAALAQDPVQCEFEYTVQAGDWLSKIADKYYGDSLAYDRLVVAANAAGDDNYTNIGNPDLIEPGWLLCIPSDNDPATGPQPAPEGLSLQELGNATYNGIYDQPITLVGGKYEGEPFVEGGASRPTVVLAVDNPVAYGDLTGDGQDDAVVHLAENSGGSGVFSYLAVVVNQDGQPVNVATTLLGDRIKINSLKVEDGQIVVDMIQAGPNDPACCPSQQVIKTFELQGEQLVEVSSGEMTQAGSGLAGTSWVLETVGGQPALPDAPATVAFGEDGRVSGTTGCNNYGMGYEVDGNNISFSPGPMTLMACPDPIGQQENAFMAALGSTATYQIQGDTLQLLDANGNVVAAFTAMKPVELAGSSWNVISYNNGKQAVVSLIIGTEITANFGSDGNLTGSAGCNDYNATYQTDGDNISIGPAISTLKACAEPEGIMEQEQQYLVALTTAATYKVELNRMEMRTSEGSLVAAFEMVK